MVEEQMGSVLPRTETSCVSTRRCPPGGVARSWTTGADTCCTDLPYTGQTVPTGLPAVHLLYDVVHRQPLSPYTVMLNLLYSLRTPYPGRLTLPYTSVCTPVVHRCTPMAYLLYTVVDRFNTDSYSQSDRFRTEWQPCPSGLTRSGDEVVQRWTGTLSDTVGTLLILSDRPSVKQRSPRPELPITHGADTDVHLRT